MSKERVNPDKLANELAGASAFFRRPAEVLSQTPDPLAPPAPVNPDPAPQPDVTTSRCHRVTTPPETARPSVGFDINRPTTSRDSLRLSTDETKALDDLRAALKWDFDLSVSKNDICRAALHHLLEDVQSRGEKSAAVSRLKRKVTGR